LQGHIVGTVDVVGMVSSEYTEYSPTTEQLVTLTQLLRMMMSVIYEECRDAWAFMNWEALSEARSGRRYSTGEDMLEVYWVVFMGGQIPEDETNWTEQKALLEQMVWEQRLPTYLHLHHSAFTYSPALIFLSIATAVIYTLRFYCSRMYSPNTWMSVMKVGLDLGSKRGLSRCIYKLWDPNLEGNKTT
jgi:hypothetical protein